MDHFSMIEKRSSLLFCFLDSTTGEFCTALLNLVKQKNAIQLNANRFDSLKIRSHNFNTVDHIHLFSRYTLIECSYGSDVCSSGKQLPMSFRYPKLCLQIFPCYAAPVFTYHIYLEGLEKAAHKYLPLTFPLRRLPFLHWWMV